MDMDSKIHDFLFYVFRDNDRIVTEELCFIKKLVYLHHLSKNDYLIRQGDSSGPVGLVYSGILRVFCLDESGNERNIVFRTKGNFTGTYVPYFNEKKHEIWFSVQALTESKILVITPDKYHQLVSNKAAWAVLEKKIFFERYLEMEYRVRSLLTEDAATRYLEFRKRYPGLENQIPLYHIASYLGISPVSLSRIRSLLNTEN